MMSRQQLFSYVGVVICVRTHSSLKVGGGSFSSHEDQPLTLADHVRITFTTFLNDLVGQKVRRLLSAT